MKAKVETPVDRNDPSQVKIEEIPLPPQEMWSELNNTEEVVIDDKPSVSPPETLTKAQEETLDFIGDGHRKVIPLSHPFRRDGKSVVEIVVRRLTIGQVSEFVQRNGDRPFTTFDVYAAMTGLPASVLRGLIDEDGDHVTDAAYAFLPLALQPGSASAET